MEPKDIRDNSVVVFLKHKGAIYNKGAEFDPDDEASVEKAIRQVSNVISNTNKYGIFNHKLPGEKK